MRQILAIAWKDVLVRFSSRTELLFFIVLPLVFTFIIGGGFTGNADRDARVRLIVVDEAHTPLAQQLIAALQKSGSVRADVLPRATADAEYAANQTVLLTIPSGFDATLLSAGATLDLQTSPSDPNAPLVERAVSAATDGTSTAIVAAQQSVAEAQRIRPFADARARQVYFDQALAAAQSLAAGDASSRIDVTHPTVSGGMPYHYDPAAQGSAGQLVTWVFIPLLGISALFAYERRRGTLRRLFTMPVTKAQLLLGAIGGQFVVALVQMAFLVGFGVLVMHVNWGNDIPGLVLMLMATGLCGAAAGTMLGAFIQSESQANGLSVLLGMVLALLGGCWYPLEFFPEGVRNIVQIVPTTWAMRGLMDLVARGEGLAAILPSAGVLLAFAALFFVAGVARFRYE